MTPKFYALVKNGRLELTRMFHNYVKSLEGKKVEIVIKPYRKTRTPSQNNYYWGCVISELCNGLGYNTWEKDEVHDAMRMMFLKKEKAGIEYVRSTTDLSTTEFTEYIEEIKRWAIMEMNILIPEPEDVV